MSNGWNKFATQGKCNYCTKTDLVKPEPFGGLDACQKCWEDICYGSDD